MIKITERYAELVVFNRAHLVDMNDVWRVGPAALIRHVIAGRRLGMVIGVLEKYALPC